MMTSSSYNKLASTSGTACCPTNCGYHRPSGCGDMNSQCLFYECLKVSQSCKKKTRRICEYLKSEILILFQIKIQKKWSTRKEFNTKEKNILRHKLVYNKYDKRCWKWCWILKVWRVRFWHFFLFNQCHFYLLLSSFSIYLSV